MIINGEEHNDLCVGIDLGTTNSVLATINVKPNGDIVSKVVKIDRAVEMYNVLGQGAKFTIKPNLILPSCVYYNDEKNYQPIVGDFAKGRYPLRPYLVAKSVKSQMANAEVKGLSSNVPDKLPRKFRRGFWNTCSEMRRELIILKKLMTPLSPCPRISISSCGKTRLKLPNLPASKFAKRTAPRVKFF